ncbi:MAG TPA: hypothetical protein RMH99_15120 [Sandaracinaceae bacterium LLY-WYZ-13_1]|nr:hypothetical protein [Sandaracinaceae bacterium LLY-WYZ-13_1]
MLHRTRPLTALLATLALGAVCAALAPGGSTAQAPQPSPSLPGTWRLDGDLAQARQTVRQAVEPALASLTPDIQRLARARIAETTWVPQTIEIQASSDRIHVAFEGSESRTFETTPGQPQNVFSRSGVRASLTQSFRSDGGIQQQFRAMDGTQYNFLIPQSDGQHLNLDVLMQSRRLNDDIRFSLRYRKQ